MKNRYIGFILLFIFLLEGTLLHWLIPSAWQQQLGIAPHFTLVAAMIYSMLRDRHIGLLLGFIFGLMHDIVYASPMIGPHGISMAFAAYGAGIAAKRLKLNMAMTFVVLSAGIIFYEIILFSLYKLFRVIMMDFDKMFSELLLPNLLFNLLFAILIYVPARKLLEMKADKREEES